MNVNMKTLDRICLTAVLSLSLLSGVWAVSLSIEHQNKIRQENNLLSERLKDLNSAETNLQQLRAVLAATRREQEYLNERIPKTPNMGDFLKSVDSLIKQRKIVLLSLQPQPVVQEEFYARIPIHLRLLGSFVHIYQLLCDLETMNRMVVLEKITITKIKQAQKCQVDLTACVFTRKNG